MMMIKTGDTVKPAKTELQGTGKRFNLDKFPTSIEDKCFCRGKRKTILKSTVKSVKTQPDVMESSVKWINSMILANKYTL